MLDFCHRDYFRRFQLNVEQYGEILMAQAFRGDKLGDEQIGFDIRVTSADFLDVLQTAGVSYPANSIQANEDGEVRIEVKSKLSETRSGEAEVVHCGANKINGVARRRRTYAGMTHLAIVLVHPGTRASCEASSEGCIVDAWLMPRQRVISIRDNTERQSKSLSIREIRNMLASAQDIVSIQSLLCATAEVPLLKLIHF